jgi:hypothetical protein
VRSSVTHTLTVKKLGEWLARGPGSPRETAVKHKLKQVLRFVEYGRRYRTVQMTAKEQRNLDSVVHIVHDWAILVRGGTMTREPHPFPINHFIQHAFLVEYRKFADFFKNHRGRHSRGMVFAEFVCKRFRPRLPVWDKWDQHINQQLMHLSYARVANQSRWDGSANPALLAEFKTAWAEFITCLNPIYEDEFNLRLRERGF